MVIRSSNVVGVLALFVVVATWIIQGKILGAIGSAGGQSWNKPLQISFWIHIFYSPAALFSIGVYFFSFDAPRPVVPCRALLLYGLTITPVVLLGACFWYVSLGMTDLEINTAVYNCNFLFVFVLSLALLKEKLTLPKSLGMWWCLGGLFLILIGNAPTSSTNNSNNSALGYVCLILSILAYAVYSVLFVKLIQPHAEHFGNTPFLGLAGVGVIGVFSLFFGPLGLFFAHISGWEVFEWPYGDAVIKGLIVSMILDLFLNMALLVGCLAISPLFMSLGSLLTIPASVLVELIFNGNVDKDPATILGILFIVAGSIFYEAGIHCCRSRKERKEHELSLLEKAASDN